MEYHLMNNSNNCSELDSTSLENIIDEHQTGTSLRMANGSNTGRLLSWGCGEFGQHGHGHQEDVIPGQANFENFYKCCGMDVRIKAISCGGSHTVIVTESDKIYSWGNGNSGQLGCGDKGIHCSPALVTIDKDKALDSAMDVAGVCCGSRHTVYWLTNGQCYSSGNNFYAQLCYDFRIKNYKNNQVLPHLLHPIIHKKIVQVSCGEKHSLFRIDTGLIAACGANGFGQLGTGDRHEGVSPRVLEDIDNVVYVACGANHSLAVTGNGHLYVWGFGSPCGSRREDILIPRRKITRETNIISAAGSGSHSMALSANGTVYSWGGGTEGQLGHGEDVTYLRDPKPLPRNAFLGRVSLIACGDSYSAAVVADGTLYMWGRSSHVIYADKPPTWRVWRPQRVAIGSSRIRKIACGAWHVLAVTGIPDWQPIEEESEEDDSSSEEEPEDGPDPHGIQQTAQDKAFINLPESKRDVRLTKSTHASKLNLETVAAEIRTMRLPREKTKLTLEEFYAPTPLPEVFPVAEVVGNPEYRAHEKGVIISDGVQEGEELQDRALTPIQDEICEQVSSQLGKDESDLLITEEDEDPIESLRQDPQGKMDKKEREIPQGELVDHPREPLRKEASETTPIRQSQRLPQPLRLTRARTMPVVQEQRREVRPVPITSTTAVPMDKANRFTVDKHLSLQMKRKGKTSRSSSLPSTPERLPKKIAHVSLKGAGDMAAPKSRSADQLHREARRSSHHPPRMTKAHSFTYHNSQSRQSNSDQISSLVSHTKLATRKDFQATAMSSPTGSPKVARQTAWEANSNELIQTRRTSNPSYKPPHGPQYSRKPAMFSSASSWRQRPESLSGKDAFEKLRPITRSVPTLQKDT